MLLTTTHYYSLIHQSFTYSPSPLLLLLPLAATTAAASSSKPSPSSLSCSLTHPAPRDPSFTQSYPCLAYQHSISRLHLSMLHPCSFDLLAAAYHFYLFDASRLFVPCKTPLSSYVTRSPNSDQCKIIMNLSAECSDVHILNGTHYFFTSRSVT